MRRSQPARRRGTVIVLAALLLSALFAMAAFAIDLGYIAHARTELQRTADACALGACSKLPDHPEAVAFAQEIAQNNYGSIGVDLLPSDVYIGYWDRDGATFTAPPPFSRRPNAVRVNLRKSRAAGNPLGLFFANVMGTSEADAWVSATAMYDHGLCGPFVGVDWLDVGGDVLTDSYDTSEDINYSAATAKDRGSICSDGPVSVHGGPIVRGDARAGRGQEVTVDGNSVVTGNIGNRIKPLNLPPVDDSEAAAVNDNESLPQVWQGQSWRDPIGPNGDFTLNAGEVYDIYDGGTYYFRNVTLNGGATLNIHAPTKIYVTGTLKRAGGCFVNNYTKIPNDLQIYSTGGTIDVTSDNPFYGVIYAPHSRVTVNASSDLFGAIVGQTLKISGGAGAHYDESLELEDVDFARRITLVD